MSDQTEKKISDDGTDNPGASDAAAPEETSASKVAGQASGSGPEDSAEQSVGSQDDIDDLLDSLEAESTKVEAADQADLHQDTSPEAAADNPAASAGTDDDEFQEIDLFDEGLFDEPEGSEEPESSGTEKDAAATVDEVEETDQHQEPDEAGAVQDESAQSDDLDVDDVLAGLSDDLKRDLETPLPGVDEDAGAEEAQETETSAPQEDIESFDIPESGDDLLKEAGLADDTPGDDPAGESDASADETPEAPTDIHGETIKESVIHDVEKETENGAAELTGEGGNEELASTPEPSQEGDHRDQEQAAGSNDSQEDFSQVPSKEEKEVEIELEPMEISSEPDDLFPDEMPSQEAAEVDEGPDAKGGTDDLDDLLDDLSSQAQPSPESMPEADSGSDSAKEPSKNQSPSSPADDAPQEGGTTSFDDDMGISLDDDELWDDSEDDAPLFDADLLGDDEPGKEAEKGATSDDASEGKRTEGDAAQAGNGKEPMSDGTSEEKESEEGAEEEATSDEPILVIGGAGPSWLPWVFTGLSSSFLIGGLFVLWGMLTAPVVPSNPVTDVSPKAAKQVEAGLASSSSKKDIISARKTQDVTSLQDIEPVRGRPAPEAIALAPFIIPVQRQGELVFFKLTVELIVPDIKTKQELKKREAWVRDAIYTELKGIEIGPGLKGDFLQKYRRPLRKRIEKELAPLEIRDVRLMGYVLK